MATTGQVERFSESSSILGDANALRSRLIEDGYLFFPGLLDPERVGELRAEVLRALAQVGWLAEGTDPLDAQPGPPRTDRDEGWWEGYASVLKLESFNRFAHMSELTGIMRGILGDDLVVHPQKISRITFPSTDYPTLPHQDFLFIRGSADVLTTWIPLGDCSAEMGGLRILAGSHREGLRRAVAAHGVGNATSEDVDPDDPRWRSVDAYSAGDVLLFHSLTVHQAPANTSDRLRLSVDYRYQSAGDPIDPAALLPTAFGNGRIPTWWAMTRDWESTVWCEVPHPVRLATYGTDIWDTPPSRLLGDHR